MNTLFRLRELGTAMQTFAQQAIDDFKKPSLSTVQEHIDFYKKRLEEIAGNF